MLSDTVIRCKIRENKIRYYWSQAQDSTALVARTKNSKQRKNLGVTTGQSSFLAAVADTEHSIADGKGWQ